MLGVTCNCDPLPLLAVHLAYMRENPSLEKNSSSVVRVRFPLKMIPVTRKHTCIAVSFGPEPLDFLKKNLYDLFLIN